MKNLNKLILFSLTFVLITFLSFNGCSDDSTLIGADLIPDKVELRQLNTQENQIPQNSYTFRTVENFATASRLLLGKYEDIASLCLMKYNIYFDEDLRAMYDDGELRVKSATIHLTTNYHFGDTTQSFLIENIAGYEITDNWALEEVTIDNMPGYASDNKIINTEMTDSTLIFDLDPDFVQQWVEAVDDTNTADYGLLLKAEAFTNNIIGFQAFTEDTATKPYLEIVYENTNTLEETTFAYNIYMDLHVVDAFTPRMEEQDMFVQAGVTLHSRLAFDLSVLPENININRAVLHIQTDTTKTTFGTSYADNVQTYFISEIESDSVLIGDENLSTTLKREGSEYTGDVTTIIYRMIVDKEYPGLLLTSYGEAVGLGKIHLYGSNAPDALKPYLTITYTKIK